MEYLHSQKGFSGELLIAKGSEISFHKAIGMASYQLNVPLTAGSKYKIASITKTFTGSLIALAEQEDLLSTGDRASNYIKELSSKFKDITIHHLLTHSSGIPHNEAIADYWKEKSRLSLSTNEVMAEINKLNLLFQPGKDMEYSSLGYYLLATILEEVYKESYQQILEKKIYKKLGMNDSGSANTLTVIKGMANGYHLLPNDSLVAAPYRNYSMIKGAGDQYSTAEDLLKWNLSFKENSLFNASVQEKIFNEGNQTSTYGYGWYTSNKKPGQYYHGGGTWGFSSHNSLYREQSLSIIILSNVSTLPVTSIASQLETIVFGGTIDLPKVHETAVKPTLDIAQYAGSYLSASGQMKLDIMLQKEQLFAQLQGNPPFLITPLGENRFLGKKVDIELEFKITEGKVVGIMAERMGRKFEFKKQ